MIDDEIRIQGSSVSEGIAIGNLYFLPVEQEEAFPHFVIAASEVKREIERYRKALHSSRKDLTNLQTFLAKEGSNSEAISIIDTHIQMLEDPFMTTHMEEKIGQMLQNTESVFRSVMGEYKQKFSLIEDDIILERVLDVKDLMERVLRHLYPTQNFSINDVPENSILCSGDLVPSVAAEASSSRVNAFISQSGGGTSHAALIAKSKGLPFITGIDIQSLQKFDWALTIVDGINGEIIINPKESTLFEYQERQKLRHQNFLKSFEDIASPARTLDGKDIQVFANIQSLEDLDLVHKYRAQGIGLFRTEFLFLHKDLHSWSEMDQYELYRKIVEKAKGLPLVFRLLDVGGDKEVFRNQIMESNPALGCRAIRYLLYHRDIFRTQLRALFRASAHGKLQILIPLISDLRELIEVKKFIESVRIELFEEGIEMEEKIPIGSMMEVPSAVLTAEEIAAHSDFLSIGTNDLIQYTLGADRCNPMVSNMYMPTHPSILILIKLIAESAKNAQIPLSICGDIASNPLYIPLLIGLGVHTFSCAPRYIPLIKKVIRKVDFIEAQELAKRALTYQNSQEIYELLSQTYDHYLHRKE